MVLQEDIKQIFVIIELVMSIAICAPLTIYFQRRFRIISNLVMIQKRYPMILKIQGIFVTAWFLCGFPPMALDYGELHYSKIYDKIITRINYSVSPAITMGVFAAAVWRFWHIYFHLKYSSSQKNSEWKYHLDPSLVERNFWLTHKKDFGSPLWTKTIAFMYYFVSVFIIIIIYQCVIDTDYLIIGHGVSCILHGILTTSIIGLAYKVPDYSDHFFIKYEMKVILWQMSIFFLGGIPVITVAIFVSPTWVMVAGSIIVCMLLLAIFMVSFWWIPKKIMIKRSKSKVYGDEKSIQSNSGASSDNYPATPTSPATPPVFTLSTTSNIPKHKENHLGQIIPRLSATYHQKQKKKSYKLHTILTHDRSLKMFMQHLAKEFSLETLLSFVEIMQFKFLFKQRFDIVDPTEIKSEMIFDDQYPLHHVVPLSLINKEGFEHDLSKYKRNIDTTALMNEGKKVCLKLNCKYIVNGSELEVNISFDTRRRLVNLMSNKQFWMDFNINGNELFCLYDKIATEMLRLMSGSFMRFRDTPEFQTAIQTFTN